MNLGSGTPPAFTYKIVIFALAVLIMMPVFTSLYLSNNYESSSTEYEDEINTLLSDYEKFTGQSVSNKTSVWALTGVYTPYNAGSSYGYTDDGWLYGSRITSYQPNQYSSGTYSYTATYSNGFYRYAADTQDGHKQNDLYTSVAMSNNKKSNIFFTQNNRGETEQGFYYDYTGWRYAFQPLANNNIIDSQGNSIPVVRTTTSLSLIWYEYYYGTSSGGSGIAGQLIISGSDSGLSYLTGQNIVQAFNSHTSTASFDMTFNGGIPITLTIKIDPVKIAEGKSIQQCYDNGWWSVMVTSQTTDATAYTSTDYSFNVFSIWDTFVSMFTFNLGDYYGIDDTTGFTLSMIMSVCMYAGLLAIGLSCYPVLLFAGLVALIQTITSVISNWGGLF